jgi:AcrR family transcriptional regulator
MPPTVTKQKNVEPAPQARAQRADARRNHRRVLDAARRCFAEDGLDAQIDDIARAAGLGVGTVYRHFPTKAALVDALAADRFERLVEKAHEALEHSDPWEGFCDFMRSSAEIQANDRALSEVMGSRPQMMDEAATAAGLYEPMAELVRRAQRAGSMRRDAVPDDVPALICGLGRVASPGYSGPKIEWERMLAIMLDGLRAPGGVKMPPS